MPKTTRRVRVAFGEALREVGDLVFESDGPAGNEHVSVFPVMARRPHELCDLAGFALSRRRRSSLPARDRIVARRSQESSATAPRTLGVGGSFAGRYRARSPKSTTSWP